MQNDKYECPITEEDQISEEELEKWQDLSDLLTPSSSSFFNFEYYIYEDNSYSEN